ncbi:nucleotidyltransferase domain-containing protein [Candidatus Dependentiae bacterium]|nr:nucleotidyltransferase domain-containing protein [Candidatus Dependentiae bacterium]
MKNEDFLKYKKKLLDIIKKKLPNSDVYLFGSRATKTNYTGSDIDIAIDDKEKIDPRIILDLYNQIEETTIPFMVDLVDINNISKSLKDRIKKEAIKWEI